MPARTITLGGEYGSGRAEIGRLLAERLGWRLLDNTLIEEIARTAQVDPELARRYDESIDPWLYRLQKALWRGGYEGVATTAIGDLFDADAMAALAERIIREAAESGRYVIVGRGSQCVLQDRDDALHVFIYAPREQRIERVQRESRGAGDPAALIDSIDHRRQSYIRRYFDQDWTDPHLYDLMICTSMGEAAAVELILSAVRLHRDF